MTTFYLIRHGNNDFVGKSLIGRTPDVHLNDAGKSEALRLADRLAGESIRQIFCSPMERCRETIAPLAARLQLDVQILDALIEVNFGDWTGFTFEELNGSELWKTWNVFRSGGRIPNGESIWEVQMRMVAAIEALRRRFTDQTMALVSHGDPLRAAVAYYLGVPLDFIHRIELSPASVTVLTIDDGGPKVLSLNGRFGAEDLRP